jgi:hypothetical protein
MQPARHIASDGLVMTGTTSVSSGASCGVPGYRHSITSGNRRQKCGPTGAPALLVDLAGCLGHLRPLWAALCEPLLCRSARDAVNQHCNGLWQSSNVRRARSPAPAPGSSRDGEGCRAWCRRGAEMKGPMWKPSGAALSPRGLELRALGRRVWVPAPLSRFPRLARTPVHPLAHQFGPATRLVNLSGDCQKSAWRRPVSFGRPLGKPAHQRPERARGKTGLRHLAQSRS